MLESAGFRRMKQLLQMYHFQGRDLQPPMLVLCRTAGRQTIGRITNSNEQGLPLEPRSEDSAPRMRKLQRRSRKRLIFLSLVTCDCYSTLLRPTDVALVTRPFNSAAGLSKPFRPPGFVDRSAKEISNQANKSHEKLPSHEELNCEPVIAPSLPVTLAEDGHLHHEEGRKSVHS
jgi:hypothetical protein